MEGHLSRNGFTANIRPTPTVDVEVDGETIRVSKFEYDNSHDGAKFSYINTHALMHKVESITVNFKQTYTSTVAKNRFYNEVLFYDDPICGVCFGPDGPVPCPYDGPFELESKTVTLELDAVFIPYGVKIVKTTGSEINPYVILDELEEFIPTENGFCMGGLPPEDKQYYTDSDYYTPAFSLPIKAWNPIPNDFSRWWFKRYNPKAYHSEMRTEYKGTKLKDLFDARDNVPVQEYARTESYLLSGTTYVAAVSNGFMIDPYLQSDIQDDIKLFSPQGFTEICQCYQYQNYYRYNNLPSDKKVLSYFLTGEMTFYKALPSDNDGNDLNEVAGNQYYVTFSSPVSSKQWKPPYAYWLFGDKQGQPVYNCSNYGGIYCDNVLPLNSFYGNYALSLLEEYNPFAATPEEIEESGGLKQRGYANDGSKLYAFISNHKPEYVGQHLSEFFYGSVSGGVYQEYLVEFPLNSGLPFNMKLWVHTYREPSPLEGGLSYGTATPENGPCSYTTTNQFIPPDAFYAPEITVTLKFKPPHNQTTGEWEGDY